MYVVEISDSDYRSSSQLLTSFVLTSFVFLWRLGPCSFGSIFFFFAAILMFNCFGVIGKSTIVIYWSIASVTYLHLCSCNYSCAFQSLHYAFRGSKGKLQSDFSVQMILRFDFGVFGTFYFVQLSYITFFLPLRFVSGNTGRIQSRKMLHKVVQSHALVYL